MIAENILVADSMNAWHLVATTLAKDEVEQPPLGIEEGIVRDEERFRRGLFELETITSWFREVGEVHHTKVSQGGPYGFCLASKAHLSTFLIHQRERPSAAAVHYSRLASLRQISRGGVGNTSWQNLPSNFFWWVLHSF